MGGILTCVHGGGGSYDHFYLLENIFRFYDRLAFSVSKWVVYNTAYNLALTRSERGTECEQEVPLALLSEGHLGLASDYGSRAQMRPCPPPM